MTLIEVETLSTAQFKTVMKLAKKLNKAKFESDEWRNLAYKHNTAVIQFNETKKTLTRMRDEERSIKIRNAQKRIHENLKKYGGER